MDTFSYLHSYHVLLNQLLSVFMNYLMKEYCETIHFYQHLIDFFFNNALLMASLLLDSKTHSHP